MQTNSGLLPSFCAPVITNGLVLAKRSERSFVVFAKSYIKFKYTTSNMDHEKWPTILLQQNRMASILLNSVD